MPAYITGLVIRRNSSDFLGNVGVARSAGVISTTGIGVIAGDIPTPGNSNGGAAIDGDYWCVPIVSQGVYGGWKFLPYNSAFGGINSVQPDAQAFAVTRISLQPQFGSDDWYILGTTAQYLTAAGGGAALPLVVPVNEVACQTLCNQNNTSGLYFGAIGIPTQTLGWNFYAYGYFNQVALTALSASGYATPALLLTALNASWSGVGTWTLSADNRTLIVTQTAGPGTDTLCAAVVLINQSA